jgi:aminopeptidase N
MVCFSLTLFAQKAHQCAEHKVKLSTLQPTASRLAMNSMEGYDVHFYKLDLNIERNSIYLSGNVSIGVKVKSSPFSQFLFELHPNFVIDSVLINGSNATFTRNGSVVSANVPGPAVGVNTLLTTRIFYRGTAPSGASAAIGNGFSTGTSTSWGNQATWSLSQPYAAYEWFPVKQSLPDKADSVEVWITTDTSNKAGSNGLLQQVTPMPNGKHRWEWKSRYPIAYYLISVSVARYVDYTIYAKPSGMTDSIPVVNFIYNNVIGSPNANSTLAFFKQRSTKQRT